VPLIWLFPRYAASSRDGRARVKRRKGGEAEAGVEKVTAIGQDSYLHSSNDNQILSKRLLDSYSSLTCFGVLRHNLLLDTYGEERGIEEHLPVMEGYGVVMGAHHSFLAAWPHFLLIGSKGRSNRRLRSSSLLLQLSGKCRYVVDRVVEPLTTILQRNSSVVLLNKTNAFWA
jgi:hypothetical protein